METSGGISGSESGDVRTGKVYNKPSGTGEGWSWVHLGSCLHRGMV